MRRSTVLSRCERRYPTYVGDLPEQLAALNRTNINVQLLTIEAFVTGKKEHVYHAAPSIPTRLLS